MMKFSFKLSKKLFYQIKCGKHVFNYLTVGLGEQVSADKGVDDMWVNTNLNFHSDKLFSKSAGFV